MQNACHDCTYLTGLSGEARCTLTGVIVDTVGTRCTVETRCTLTVVDYCTRQHPVKNTDLMIVSYCCSFYHCTDLSDNWNPCNQGHTHTCRRSSRLDMYHHSDMDYFDIHQPLQSQSCHATANQNEVAEQEEPIRFHRFSHVTYFLIRPSNQA